MAADIEVESVVFEAALLVVDELMVGLGTLVLLPSLPLLQRSKDGGEAEAEADAGGRLFIRRADRW